MEKTLQKFEDLTGARLVVTLDTREQAGYACETWGNYLQCEMVDNPLGDDEPPVFLFYEGDLVQFYHDATPYAVSANTESQALDMSHFMLASPVHIDQVTAADFRNFINFLLDEEK